MRPSKLRSERQQQYQYLTGVDYQNELKKQVEEKKQMELANQIQNQAEILQHYKNYQLGAGQEKGEDPLYMNDLQSLMHNQEREIERLQQIAGQGRPQQFAAQNEFKGFKQEPQEQKNSLFEKHYANLFDDKFINNYHNNKQGIQNENLNILNSAFGNNVSGQPINFPQAFPQGFSQDNERERRLRLRDQERQKRSEGQMGGAYGQAQDNLIQQQQLQQQQPLQQQQKNIFGEEQAASKRDQIWQQKMMQKRVESADRAHRVPNVQQQLPIYQNAGVSQINSNSSSDRAQQQLMSPGDNLRNSRAFLNFNEARKLDQSINLEQNKPTSQLPPQASGILPIGHNEVDKRRRENEKKQMQQEYQLFLRQQQQDQTPQSAPNSVQRPPQIKVQEQQVAGGVLKAGGMQQIGIHQAKQQEDKLKNQREYKDFLDQQKQTQQKQIPSVHKRREQLSNQVFEEILQNSGQKINPAFLPHQDNDIQFQQPLRGQSAQHQSRKEILQQQYFDNNQQFFKNIPDDDLKKKNEIDKKKEYAQQLQQQMALKQAQLPPSRRRGTTQQVPQQVPQQLTQDAQIYGVQQQQFVTPTSMMNRGVFEYQPLPQQQQLNYQVEQPFVAMQQQFQGFQQINEQPQYPQQQYQVGQPDLPQQRSKQEEYRLELERQIKIKEDKKKQEELEQQKIEQVYNNQIKQEQQHAQQNFVRQRTDVSKVTDSEAEQQVKLKQMRLQEDLSRQIEEKRRLKEEEKTKLKREEEEHERRLQVERDKLQMQEINDLKKENKDYKGPNEKKKNVRRDQFEPSSNNPIALNVPKQQEQSSERESVQDARFSDINQRVKEDIFAKNENDFAGFQLPINNKREDLFKNEGNAWQKAQDFNTGGDNFIGQTNQPVQSYQQRQTFEYQPYQAPQQQSFQMPQQLPQQMTYQQPQQQQDMFQQQFMQEQQKMLVKYQEALEQVIQFKKEYFEQMMDMREQIVREKEQLLEYEKLKMQQNQEVTQLETIQYQLGRIMSSASNRDQSQTYLNQNNGQFLHPQVQTNLNMLIKNQTQEMIRMSQRDPLQELYNKGSDQLKDAVIKSRMETDNKNNGRLLLGYEGGNSMLEKSLSSDTKLVGILPLKNISSQLQQNEQLMQTWNQDKLQHLQASPQVQASLQGSSHFISNMQNPPTQQPSNSFKNNNQLQNNSKFWGSRPATSQLPETIQELPNQEDDQMNSLKHKYDEMQQQVDLDLNSRSSSEEKRRSSLNDMTRRNDISATMPNQVMTNTNPFEITNTLNKNLIEIDKMISTQNNFIPQQHPVISPNTNQKKQMPQQLQNATQSSFYNNTLHQNQEKQKSQLKEINDQLYRFIGMTMKSDQAKEMLVQAEQNDEQEYYAKPAKTQPNFNPLKIAQDNERLGFQGQIGHFGGQDDRDYMIASQINIANSISGTHGIEMMNIVQQERFTNNKNMYGMNQFKRELIQDESKFQNVPSFQQTHQDEPKEILMSKPMQVQHTDQDSQDEDQDVWNDPDLIPPPVVMDDESNQSYKAFEIEYNQQQNAFLDGQSQIEDKTLRNLQMFSPPNIQNNTSSEQMARSNMVNIGLIAEESSKQERTGYEDDERSDMMEESKRFEDRLQVRNDDNVSEKATTKKQRDILEVQKLIQRANDTTKNLLENSDNFKFKLKSDSKRSEVKSANRRQSKIKVADPFKQFEKNSVNQNTSSFKYSVDQSQQQEELNEDMQDKKDDYIMDNLDIMINNLQNQKERNGQAGNQPYVQLNSADEYRDQEHKQMKMRPISANMNQDPSSQHLHQQQKYGFQIKSASLLEINQQQQQQILRPVSGKSNSTRYQLQSASSNRRAQLQSKQVIPVQQPFYDDESEDGSVRQGYNLAQVDESNRQDQQETFRPMSKQ